MTADPYELERFVTAQEPVIDRVRAELRAGRKQSHWMWFVFPQIAGLGRTAMAQLFAIGSLDEARAYLAHPVLGPRLRECTRLVLDVGNGSLDEIFGTPDDLKFRSCMTLFACAAEDNQLFLDALDAHCDGLFDPLTTAKLNSSQRR
jgi:uncharacterized protein (DUF1810 family)